MSFEVDVIRQDSVLSAISRSLLANRSSGMGTSRDTFTETEVGYPRLLGELELRSLYRGNWWIRRIIDTPAEDMTKSGIRIELPDGDADVVQKVLGLYAAGGELNPYSRKFSGPSAFRKAERWARLFGRGYIVLRVNNGEDLSRPLKKVRSFDGLSVLDRYQLRPAIGEVNYEDPEFYQIIRRARANDIEAFGQKIHESRVLPFDGEMIHPFDLHWDTTDGAHDSVLQCIFEIFCRYYTVQNAIAKGLDSYSLFKVAINGLAELLGTPGGEDKLALALDAIAEQMSMHRVLVQDGSATNSDFQERSFSGVAENAVAFREELTAASNLPHYKLWGTVGKAALGDSGNAETRAWADRVATMQRDKFADNHRRLFNALFEATTGAIPEGYEINYESIYTPTDNELADLEKKHADRYEVLVRAEILTPDEARVAIATDQPISTILSSLGVSLDELKKQQEEEAAALAEEESSGEFGAIPDNLPSIDQVAGLLDSAAIIRTDAGKKKSGKKRNCTQGQPCGGSCISRKKTCRKTPTAKQKQLAQQIKSSNAGAGNPAPTPTPAPDPQPENRLTDRPNTGTHKDVPSGDPPPADKYMYEYDKSSNKAYQVIRNSKGKEKERKEISVDEYNNIIQTQFNGKARLAEELGIDVRSPSELNKLRKEAKENQLNAVKKNANLSDSQAKASIEAISDYSAIYGSTGYTAIRNVQRGIFKDDDGDPLSQSVISRINGRINDINAYIENAPTYKGTVYRGMSFDSKADRDSFIQSIANGYSLEAMSSFSSSKSVTKEFSQGAGIIFAVQNNRSGVSIKGMSKVPAENEVLVPKGARYNIKTIQSQGAKMLIELEELDS
jgi:hypothetical protein